MADVLNILSGFMKGRNKRRQEDLQLQQLKLQTQSKLSAEKIALEKEKRAAAKDAQEQKFMDMFMQQLQGAETTSPGTSETTPMGDSFPEQEGPSLLDILSREQMGETFKDLPPMESMLGGEQPQTAQTSPLGKMSPMQMAIVQKLSGFPMVAAGSLNQRTDRATALHGEAEKRVNKPRPVDMGTYISWRDYEGKEISRDQKPIRGVPVDVKGPGGEISRTFESPYLTEGEGLGKTPPQKKPPIQITPSIKDMPIDEGNLPLWRNKITLESPPVGTTPKQAQDQGYVRVTTGQLDAIQSFGQVENILAQIGGLMSKVFPDKEEGAMGRVIGGTKRVAGAMSQADPDAATLMGLINGTLSPIIRNMGEKGTLSDTDIKRAANLFPKLTDSGTVAWQRLEQLKTLIREGKEKKLGGVMEKTTQRKPGESISDYLKRTGK